jgi:superfamily II DNA or RNA helicase
MQEVLDLISRTKVSPRPYQQRITSKAIDYFRNQGMRSLLIESPTGSGKTVMALLIARLMQDLEGIRVGWVAMRRNLLTQAAEENRAKEINGELKFISMFDKDPPTGLDMLVVDEAQHDAASSMAFLHQRIQPRYILGLSATPFRHDRVKLCFDKVIRDAGIHPLIQDGFLSQYHHYTIPEFLPRTVAEFYLGDRQRWGKSIMYFHTLEQCRQAAEALNAGGARADVVTGSSDRESQIERFRKGKLDVLVNCVVLVEGFDCVELKTVFVRPSCKGATVQMCGRVLRKHPAMPFKQIVQCRKSPWPFLRTASAALTHSWVEGEWRTLEVNPMLNAIQHQTLCALAKIQIQLPPFVLKRQSRQPRQRREQFSL